MKAGLTAGATSRATAEPTLPVVEDPSSNSAVVGYQLLGQYLY
jgi:hypothetical protein